MKVSTLILAAAFCLAIAGLYFLPELWPRAALKRPWRYSRKPLLTPNEFEFFGRLTQAVPEHYVFPQVAMSQLIQISGTFSKRTRMQGFNTIGRKVVDFVVADSEFKNLVIVELDDRTHSPSKDKLRDAMTREAGYLTLRYESRSKPTIRELRRDLRRLLP